MKEKKTKKCSLSYPLKEKEGKNGRRKGKKFRIFDNLKIWENFLQSLKKKKKNRCIRKFLCLSCIMLLFKFMEKFFVKIVQLV